MTFSSNDIKNFISNINYGAPITQNKKQLLPKISIVIPLFNQALYIERTILSVINQNYPNTELIIIDGGSTDGSVDVLKKYQQFIRFWISEPDNGQSHALNKGFKVATGDILGWQNSDDIYLQNSFWKVEAAFRSDKDVSVCYGNWFSIDEKDHILERHYSLKARYPNAPFENMDAYNQCLFWSKSAHERFGQFDERLFQIMDNDLIIRLVKNEGVGKFRRVDDFLGAFRRHSRQKTGMTNLTQCTFNEEKYIEEKYNFPKADSFIGQYYRLKYRTAQLVESLMNGGINYTWTKCKSSFGRRGQFF